MAVAVGGPFFDRISSFWFASRTPSRITRGHPARLIHFDCTARRARGGPYWWCLIARSSSTVAASDRDFDYTSYNVDRPISFMNNYFRLSVWWSRFIECYITL